MRRRFAVRRFFAGFTLVELVTTLLLVGILALIFSPSLPSANAIVLWSTANSLAADLRRAQTLAMSRGTAVCLKRMSGNQYGIFETATLADQIVCSDIRFKDAFTGRDLTVILEKGIELSGDISIVFNSLGKTSSDATFYLTADQRYRFVAVNSLTGSVAPSSNSLPVATP